MAGITNQVNTNPVKELFQNRKFLIVIFVILLLYGGLIRLYNLGGESFWIDESISAVAARAILEKGAPIFESGFLYSRASVFHYLMSFFLLFGQSELNARLVSVIFGLATCVLIFFIGRLYNKETGWISFALSLFMEIFIVYSREARMYQMEMFFFFLALYFLYKYMIGGKHLVFAILSFLVAYETHVVALLLIPLMLYAIFVRLKGKGLMEKRHIKIGLIAGAAVILLYFAISHTGMVGEFRWRYISNYLSHLKYYAPFLLVGILGFLLSWKKRLSIILAFALAANLFMGGLNLTFGYRYIYLCFLPAVVLSAYVLSNIRLKWAVVVIYMLWLSNIFTPVTYSFVLTPVERISNYDPTAPRLNFRPLYDELKQSYDGETFISTFGPPAEWYFKRPDYWTYFSMSGLRGREQNESLYLGKDVYTGAEVLYNLTDFLRIKGEKVVVADSWSGIRIDPLLREYFVTNCTEILNKEDISAYRCS